MKSYDKLFIGGDWTAPAGSGTIEVINPTTEEVCGSVPDATEADVNAAVAAARQAFDHGPWPRMTPVERAAIVTKVSEAIKAELDPMAQLISTEMGSPIGWGMMAQVLAPAMIFDYYVGLASTYPFDEMRPGLLGQVLVASEPVGVVAAITPWNVPLFLAAAKLGSVARRGLHGCVQAGPRDAFRRFPPRRALRRKQVCPRASSRSFPQAARSVSTSSGTRGSTRSRSPARLPPGRRSRAACGENLKRYSLELGGKSAAVLLDDVDLSQALPMLMPNAMMNNGEACIAQTRILAPRDRYSRGCGRGCRDGFGHEGRRSSRRDDRGRPTRGRAPARPGRGIHQDRSGRRREGRHRRRSSDGDRQGLVRRAHGVRGRRQQHADRPGGDLRAGYRVIPYDGDEQAIYIANDSSYGLCGSVWTGDPERGLKVARGVRTGTYMLNNPMPIDFATPFGGYKESGIGREFGREGLELFLERKSITLPAGFEPPSERGELRTAQSA